MITKFPCYQTKLMPPMAKAKDALEDRTKWLHQSHVKTLRVRILEAETIADGWGFKILESYVNGTKRQYRVVVFDVFGDIRYTSEDYNTAKDARSKFFAEDVEMEKWTRRAIQIHRANLQLQMGTLTQWELEL